MQQETWAARQVSPALLDLPGQVQSPFPTQVSVFIRASKVTSHPQIVRVIEAKKTCPILSVQGSASALVTKSELRVWPVWSADQVDPPKA